MIDHDIATRLVDALLDHLLDESLLVCDISAAQCDAMRAAVQYELDISGRG
jgi:hypothetical protein